MKRDMFISRKTLTSVKKRLCVNDWVLDSKKDVLTTRGATPRTTLHDIYYAMSGPEASKPNAKMEKKRSDLKKRKRVESQL